MRTAVSSANPFGCTRTGFAWEQVEPGAAHLDCGCYDGRFLRALRDKSPRRLAGVDANGEAIEHARSTCPEIEFMHVGIGHPLPFPDGTFDSVSLLDVLEHVDDQPALLRELHRVLRDGGRLIVTVPGRHVLSFMDLGNLKFRFPRLHRWFYSLTHGKEAYRRRYVDNPDGLIGDISARKRWHEHFSRQHLGALLTAGGFEVLTFDGSGLLMRAVSPLRLTVGRIGWIDRMLRRFLAWDARRFSSANLFCLATKAPRADLTPSEAPGQGSSAPGPSNTNG